jgi:NitT/TauT family transport system permease protein
MIEAPAAGTAKETVGRPVTSPEPEAAPPGTKGRLRTTVARVARFLAIPFFVLLVLAVFLGVWQYAVDHGWIDIFFFSSPSRVGHLLWQEQSQGILWTDAWTTLREALKGFVYGTVTGVIIGFVLGQSRWLSGIVMPFLNLLNTLPRIALAPMFILWFGIGETSKVVLVFSVVVVILIFNTYAATQTVDVGLVTTARLLGASRVQIMRKVTLPWCIPWIISGMRIALAWSLGAAVIGEYIASRNGVGYRIANYSSVLNQTGVLAGCVVLLVMSAGLFLILGLIERRLLRWRPNVH